MDDVESVVVHDPYEEFARQNEELAARIQTIVDKGRAHLEQGLIAEARKEFFRALALFPYVPAALNNLALLAFGEGDSERASAYLRQLLQFHEAEPTANALMARYWAGLGAAPLAVAHAEMAVRSALAIAQSTEGSDPSRVRRSLEFACQSLALLGDDGLLAHLFRASGEPTLMPVTLLHIGIAFYNRGDFLTAKRLWQTALRQQPDLEPARIYLEMCDLLERHKLLPFHLDHRLEMPQAEKGRRVWLVHVPTLFVAGALARLYQGSTQEAEEAIPLLAGVGIPGLDRILLQVGTDSARATSTRILAGLQLAATGHEEQAAQICDAIDGDSVDSDEQACWYLLQGLVAEIRGKSPEAAKLAAAGLATLEQEATASTAQPIRQMLAGLLARSGDKPEPGKTASDDVSLDHEEPLSTTTAQLRLPDAAWLHSSQLHPLTTVLEELLVKRPRQVVEELAGRLGEQAAQELQTAALVRRLAMRMRSMQPDRVMGSLSAFGREALEWLDAGAKETTLNELYAWMLDTQPQADPWIVIEELYRSCLVDIGMSTTSDEEGTVLRVAIPIDLNGRFHLE
jgi:tetratricopeptide (TPR) repeat protein